MITSHVTNNQTNISIIKDDIIVINREDSNSEVGFGAAVGNCLVELKYDLVKVDEGFL